MTHINIGNGARISFELLGITRSPIIHGIVGTTGFVEVAALILFGINIWVTMTGEVEFEEHKIREITGNETVYALTEQFPQIIPILRELEYSRTRTWGVASRIFSWKSSLAPDMTAMTYGRYTGGLNGRRIHIFARIVAAVSLPPFHAMSTPNAPRARKPLT